MNSKRPRNNRNNQRRGGGGQGNRPNSFDSNGPDVKIRGNPSQIFEKYQSLARDATLADDRVMAENYLQHAEHYYRIFSENNAQRQQQQQQQQRQQGQQQEQQHGQPTRQNEPKQSEEEAVAAGDTPQEAAPEVTPVAPQEAPQEAIVEKKEIVVETPGDPANEPQPVID